MKNNRLYNKILGIYQDDVIHMSDYNQIKELRKGIYEQIEQLADDPLQKSQRNILNVFKKALNVKYETYNLIELIQNKKQGIEIPIYRRDLRFMAIAKKHLDNSTYEYLLQIAMDMNISVENPAVRKDTKENNIGATSSNSETILYNKSLDITSEDIMNTNDIELLTEWLADIHFQLYWMNNSFEINNNIKLQSVIKFTDRFRRSISKRIKFLMVGMMKEAGFIYPGKNDKERNCIATRFLCISKKILPSDKYNQILIESRWENIGWAGTY